MFGGGEWLLGPLVTAQYGGQILWLATLAILLQVSYNLAAMLHGKCFWLGGLLSLFRLLHKCLSHADQYFEFAYGGLGHISLYPHDTLLGNPGRCLETG